MNTDISETSEPAITKKNKSKKNRCSFEGCKRRIKLIDMALGNCKCGNMYCAIHRNPNTHNCTYDWHLNDKTKLSERLLKEKCVATQINAI